VKEINPVLTWLIPLVLILASGFAIMYMVHVRMEKLATQYDDQVRFEQRTNDRLDFLEKFCCEEMGHCKKR